MNLCNVCKQFFSKKKLQKLYHDLLKVMKKIYICPALQARYQLLNEIKQKFLLIGALAQLARVLDWQSRGHRFDSGMLH
jgi:hypothetical protein